MSLRTSSSRLSDAWLFFRKFCSQGTRVGSVVPSSSQFARRMLMGIDWSHSRCIVELGAGTGAITAEMLRLANSACRCVIIERDADFCCRLAGRFPIADVVHADACDLDAILRERQIEHVDHILCGLALPWFTSQNRHRVLDGSRRVLTAAGSFRQMTYMPWVHYATYHRYFAAVGFRWVMLNVPPGGYYLCEKPRHTLAAP